MTCMHHSDLVLLRTKRYLSSPLTYRHSIARTPLRYERYRREVFSLWWFTDWTRRLNSRPEAALSAKEKQAGFCVKWENFPTHTNASLLWIVCRAKIQSSWFENQMWVCLSLFLIDVSFARFMVLAFILLFFFSFFFFNYIGVSYDQSSDSDTKNYGYNLWFICCGNT